MTLGASSPQGPYPNAWVVKPVNNLTGAGSTQGTALAIPAGQDGSIFTTVGSSTGAILPATGVGIGEEYVIANHGVNALAVYPPTGGKMGTAGTNAAYSLTAGKTGYFMYVGQLQWTTNP
jgi:hypothetical protein